jgi:outer membrane protein OmpA-like peptidoglycan-associated protein
MKRKTTYFQGARKTWLLDRLAIAAVLFGSLLMAHIQAPLHAQAPQYAQPSWWFGIAGAGNVNFYRGSTQQLTTTLISPAVFERGTGLGLYLAPLVEFHRPTSNWGIMLQSGYDSRRATYNQVYSNCNCPRDLATKMSYITVEPSVRFAPAKSPLYFFFGPRVAINVKHSFVYKMGTNPNYPEQVPVADVEGDLSHVKPLLISAQAGVGYDFQLSSPERETKWVISPFASFQPYFGQSPRTIETWNITTLRIGAALKFGRGRQTPAASVEPIRPTLPVAALSPVTFSVHAPDNTPAQRTVREVFPLRNYVFFDLGSTAVPERYVLLRKDQVRDFKEDQVQLYTPKNLSGRSGRQMVVYYNVLNILGDRMLKQPTTTITLVGSSEQGPADGLAMATSVQRYLVDVFGIAERRIKVDGRTKPALSSQEGATRELALLKEGDRRVTIETDAPELLMEFRSGPTAPLKPVEIPQAPAPLNSYVSFEAKGSDKAYDSWSLEIMDSAGVVQQFGPYTKEKVSIATKDILGKRSKGAYTVTMIGETKNDKTVMKSTKTNIVLWTPAQSIEVMRFSVIYEFDESKTIDLYEKYLTEVVIPKIPKGGTVIMHGYTDEIGDVAHNQALSEARANDVKSILQAGLAKVGRTDVKFDAHGSGEDPLQSPFENVYPEERFYNRTVVIDILPAR